LLSVFHDIIKKAKLTKIPWIISQKADARKKTNKAKVDRYGKLDLDHCTKLSFTTNIRALRYIIISGIQPV
jgi:hypothetical protein